MSIPCSLLAAMEAMLAWKYLSRVFMLPASCIFVITFGFIYISISVEATFSFPYNFVCSQI